MGVEKKGTRKKKEDAGAEKKRVDVEEESGDNGSAADVGGSRAVNTEGLPVSGESGAGHGAVQKKQGWSFGYWLFVFGAIGLALSSITSDDVAWVTWAVKRAFGGSSVPPPTPVSVAGAMHKGCPFHFGKSNEGTPPEKGGSGGDVPKAKCPFHSSGPAKMKVPPSHHPAMGDLTHGTAEHVTDRMMVEGDDGSSADGTSSGYCEGEGKGNGKSVPMEEGLGEEEGPVGVSLLWMAPFFSGGGYCSEAVSFAEALDGHVAAFGIVQHGDALSWQFRSGLPRKTIKLLDKLLAARLEQEGSIVVCHSEPGAWDPPLYQTPPCPSPSGGAPLFVVGRTMFETDRVNPNHVERINRMGEVWVPTRFHVNTFVQSGVDPMKVIVVPEAVDVHFFSPDKTAIDPPFGSRLFGPPVLKVGWGAESEGPLPRSPFVFLSIFKWETRKGWDVLIRAFLQEFSAGDDVILYLLTNAYHTDHNFGSKIQDFVDSQGLAEPAGGWPALHICGDHIPQADLPGVYKRAGAFVLPSRGEGWGRPHVEAMAMSLPVIATNWSGMTEYMTERNSYPLRIDGLSEVEDGPFKGHLWADPSVDDLRRLMRHVYVNREESQEKGRVAREDMVRRFAPEVVARQVVLELRRIKGKAAAKG